jgi:IS30 family transposase
MGKFILIELTNKVLIEAYNKFTVFTDANQEKINKIYEKLNMQVPKEFIGFRLFYEN